MRYTPSDFHTSHAIGTGQSNVADVRRLRRALSRIGYGRFGNPPAGNVTPGLMQAVERFQTDFGLEPDAVIRPGGPTERTLSMAIGARDSEGEAAMHKMRDAFARRARVGLSFRPHSKDRDAGLWLAADGRALTDTEADTAARKAKRPAPAAGPGGTGDGSNRKNPVTPDILRRRARVGAISRPTGRLKAEHAPEEFMDRVEGFSRRNYVDDWRKKGWTQAADNLERYLDGTGKALHFTREEARGFGPIRGAEDENKSRIENRSFLARTDNSEYNKKLKSLEDGKFVDLEDNWKVDYNSIGAFKGAAGLSPGEEDFYFAFGRTPFSTKIKMKATRVGDTIYITGTVFHDWKDRYDFQTPQPGSGDAVALEADGRARPFDIRATWKQRVRATVKRLPNGELTNPQVEWTELDEQ